MVKVAAFTMAHNEKYFLPIWHRHYGQQLGYENCYIIDHGSSDGSTSHPNLNCTKLPASSLDEISRAELVGSFQKFLLSSYDAVIFSDSDEILVADPKRYISLIDLIERTNADVIAGVGLALTHAQDLEPEIDYQQPILQQRRFVRFQDLYCKPLVGRRPISWQPGFHRCNNSFVISKSLYIFHLKAVDINQSLSNLARRREIVLSHRSMNLAHGVQFRFSDEEMMKVYFPLRGTDFARKTQSEFHFDEHLIKVANGSLSALSQSFKETFELPDHLRSAF